MLELMFCSTLTILPDYLRRFVQGKRIGQEITLFSVWYELRWGITLCAMLTVSLITVVFYFHPATSAVTSFYRTVPVLPETGGRVAEIYVKFNDPVKAGDPLFHLDSSLQEAALATAEQRIKEIEAQIKVAEADLLTADAKIAEAQGAYQQALDELAAQDRIRETKIPMSWLCAESRSCKTSSTPAPVRWRQPRPTRRRRKPRQPSFCRHNGPAPWRKWPRHRRNWTR